MPIKRLEPKEIKKRYDEIQAESIYEKLAAHITAELASVKMPSPVFCEGCIWLPTGTWVLSRLELSEYDLTLVLSLVWIDANGFRDTNPMGPGKIGRPENFGPGFELPIIFRNQFALTKIPTTQGGWATGIAPAVPAPVQKIVSNKIREFLNSSGYIVRIADR